MVLLQMIFIVSCVAIIVLLIIVIYKIIVSNVITHEIDVTQEVHILIDDIVKEAILIVICVATLLAIGIRKIIAPKVIAEKSLPKQVDVKQEVHILIDCIINEANEIKEQLIHSDDKSIDLYSNSILFIFNTIHQLNIENNEKTYIETISVGLETDSLLVSGFLRKISKCLSMSTSMDVENVCLKFYSLTAHAPNILTRILYDETYIDLCRKMVQALPNSVVDVIIDDFTHRQQAKPLRIIDHALQQSLLRTEPRVSVAINPTNAIMKKMMQKLNRNANDAMIPHLMKLLYEIELTRHDLPLPDPESLSNKVIKLLNLGLEIRESDQCLESHSDSGCEMPFLDRH
eukprot:268064_1